ncbi:Protein of unknown function (DUF3421) [Beggiatoa alba B18LD]|uniref:Uncharacterized protein n=1 Tax=Beggiatoa alba B18LD TaxID=395493 RepID=I3CF26_9GAMM|nr:DUF3421 domain-containing protein [Beggiatoa alba]EIJ42219.1 Protein of unknown function (DUF3421) [Beggiatoa alba B18LD]
MKNSMLYCKVFFLFMFIIMYMPRVYAEAEWQAASGDNIPNNAFVGGNEAPPEASSLFICRAVFHQGVHTGKARVGFNGCNIGWGDAEHTVSNYEVLLHNDNFTWVAMKDGKLPQGAVLGGREHSPNNENLYVCRAHYENGIHPGKIRAEFGGCHIGWGGKEILIKEYEVLVEKNTNTTQTQPAPMVEDIDLQSASLAIKNFYDTQGEWAGVFYMGDILQMRVEQGNTRRNNNNSVFHVEYRYIPIPNNPQGRTDTGIDRRTFTARHNQDGSYSIIKMGDYMSARF